MARLPYLDQKDLAPENRDLLARNINLYRALVHSPGGARRFHGLGHYIRHESRLDPRLRELAILQVGYLTRSPYEFSHHIKIGRSFGVSEGDLRELIEESDGQPSELDPTARAVIRAAREMTRDLRVSDETFAELQRHLDNESLTDLVITIGHYNAVVRILATLEIDVEPDYQPYLEEFPLPTD